MAKADKATSLQRTQDITRILLAGGEFAEIRQYASDRGWDLSERQLRRYQEKAYKQLAEATHLDVQQLLGRHLMQRRALYARALKIGDLRTALQVLRDEAALEGLYPPTKVAPTTPDGKPLFQGGENGPPLSREERFQRLLVATQTEDKTELRLLEQVTPQLVYHWPDTHIPLQVLHTCALMYVAEQLDHGAMVFVALWEDINDRRENGRWDFIGKCHAYRFVSGREAWQQFTSSLGVDGDQLAKENHRGSFLELIEDRICEIAPSRDEMAALLEQEGQDFEGFQTADEMADDWQSMLDKALER